VGAGGDYTNTHGDGDTRADNDANGYAHGHGCASDCTRADAYSYAGCVDGESGACG